MILKETTLGTVSLNIQTGPFGSQLHQSDYSEIGIPVVMPKDLINGKISEDSIARVGSDHVNRLSRHKIEAGDILYSRRGDVGRCAYATEHEAGWLCGTGCILVTVDSSKADSKYIFYRLQMPETVGWVVNHAVGSTMLNLNTTILSGIPLKLPSLKEQKSIVQILSAYDDIIENNRKQIKLLEETAQRLYKEWFVDLRFPGYENTPISDGVPQGWRKISLGDIAPILTGKKDANFGTKDGAYPFFTCSQEPIKSPSYSFDTSAIVLAGNGDFNVKLYRGKFEAYQRTYVLSPIEEKYLYLLYNAVNENMAVLVKGASGSTIKFLTKGMIESIPLFIPTDRLLEQYNSYSETVQKKIECLKCAIVNATEARDRLLPKLMSGELME